MGNWIVWGSVWLALACFPAGALGTAASTPGLRRMARRVWTLGCLAFLLHVVSSFGVFYGWSHTIALRETARQVAELTGRSNGTGLYLNYLFTMVWVADAAWWWLAAPAYMRRPWIVVLLEHGFFLFMIFNATVVFEQGAIRVLGLGVTALAGVGLWLALRRLRDDR